MKAFVCPEEIVLRSYICLEASGMHCFVPRGAYVVSRQVSQTQKCVVRPTQLLKNEDWHGTGPYTNDRSKWNITAQQIVEITIQMRRREYLQQIVGDNVMSKEIKVGESKETRQKKKNVKCLLEEEEEAEGKTRISSAAVVERARS